MFQISCLQTHKRCVCAAQWIGTKPSLVRWARCIRTGTKPPPSTPTLAHYVLACWRAGSWSWSRMSANGASSVCPGEPRNPALRKLESIQGIIPLERRAYWKEGSMWPSSAVYCGGMRKLPSDKVMYFFISTYFSNCPSMGSIGGSGNMWTGLCAIQVAVK